MITSNLLAQLTVLPDSEDRSKYVAFVEEHGDAALRREGGPEHITGSCFVFSPALDRVLLCFHRKGQFWVQFGGHLENDDATVADTAQREAREESGIATLTLATNNIMDLDRHELHGGFKCAAHWDVGFVALADPATNIEVSDESEDVQWFPVNDLPNNLATGFENRLANILKQATQAGLGTSNKA
ncbi:8-oxo-dGTP pyrophosphatase MutT (NUDIX family) [Neomicrococcus aestuarii]|uniref:8-oxo-dGTP pyrophosphatase MutT (NUDIX family) n=1 Tax=Neomicrococcus aestuarii TaxID=556325 RepID=A0A7W8TW01_9MICC|nr:NUDIX domain-containing protein [Neomicrococcus aestuarii]MBB5513130.1 8-oxo-dGTP pyrophosphatase MutT (NUDIX family) [Neomicrococcus aestuarii]